MLFYANLEGSISPPSYKEAITLPARVQLSSPVEEMREELKPKLCKLEKTSAGYGFHLNGIEGVYGQYIKEVRISCHVCHSVKITSNQKANTEFVSGGEGWSSRQGRPEG